MEKGKPKLYIHVGQATHFLQWEYEEFKKYFDLVDEPAEETSLLAFGPDVLGEAATLPAKKRFIVLFPGFGHNPVHNKELGKEHRRLISKYYDIAFINPGPLEIAYKNLDNIKLYPFSVNEKLLAKQKTRRKVKKMIHISNDAPQKDWQRSEKIMALTGIPYEIFPPRDARYFQSILSRNDMKNRLRKLIHVSPKKYLPFGYVSHDKIIKKYYQSDVFVHVADIVEDELYLDGKYTATLIEAGMSGCIIFWHDTFNLGNDLKTVFNLPLNEKDAAKEMNRILLNLDIKAHSEATRAEFLKKFNIANSVKQRATTMLRYIE